MKLLLPITIAILAVFANGNANAQVSSTPPCRAGTLDLRANGKGQVPQSVQDTALSHCDTLFNIGYADFESYLWEQSYDTLRLFMEQCPFYYDSPEEFGYTYDDVDGWQAGGAGRWPDFLAWLKKVLYYNPDTTWYCQDALDMVYALQNDDAASMAALNYVVTSGKCPGFQSQYNSASNARHYQWLDSIENKYALVNYPPSIQGGRAYEDSINADTLAHPYDSTIPSLYAVDLQILMGQQYASVQQNQATSSQALLSAQLLENPMTSEIDIAFEMGRTAMVSMQLSDLLGRNIPIANAKYQLEQPGQHDASIPAPNLPPGTYYLRITTDVGDAITLKVVKE